MVLEVPGNDVGQGPGREDVAARRTAALPALVREVAEERDRRLADGAELVDVARPRHLVGVGRAGTRLLIEAGERGVESAGEPEGAGEEHPLRVADVAEQLANAPLARLVAAQGLLLGDRPQPRRRVAELLLENADHVLTLDAVDVAEVVRRGLASLRQPTGSAHLRKSGRPSVVPRK